MDFMNLEWTNIRSDELEGTDSLHPFRFVGILVVFQTISYQILTVHHHSASVFCIRCGAVQRVMLGHYY